MEVKEMKPTAIFERMVVTEWGVKDGERVPLATQPLKLTVHFIGMDANIDMLRPRVAAAMAGEVSLTDFNQATISKAIDEWDLTIDGKPVPVNAVTKEIYVPHIAASQTEDGMVVGHMLADFVRDSKNFLKN